MKNGAVSILRLRALPGCHLRYPPPSVTAEVGAWPADTFFQRRKQMLRFVSANEDELTTSVSPSRSCTASVWGVCGSFVASDISLLQRWAN